MRCVSKVTCAALACVICGFSAGCADAATTPVLSAAHVAVVKSDSKRFCAYEISTPTTAEVIAIDHYWTPLARSATKVVSQGKMAVTVPKVHLTRSQRRALRLAEWAERAFSPKPKLVCVQIPQGVPHSPAGAGPVSPK